MDNQHQKISGYRDLTQEEIDLMNRIKAAEAEVLALHREVELKLLDQTSGGTQSEEWKRAEQANAFHWLNTCRTDLEVGFMLFVRAVAQPQPRKS